jgi:hypothetical protein
MISATLVTVLGTIASGGPTLAVDAEGDPEARFTLVVSGQAVLVATSSTHALWVASTVNSGVVAQVEGYWRVGGDGLVLQAVCVDTVDHAVEVC